ncbi:uncharacterized protein [Littorina saxatilis]|uniref:Adenosine kinase n=1 Tax=Littorina saxatilis TaxID=31220 RepID=A0AAN9BU26_9CAEN
MASEGVLLVYGSPLLDIIVRHPSAQKLLQKYGLDANSSVFAQEKHQSLYKDLEEKYGEELQYAAGGTALNAARVVQWVLRVPRVTSFFGGVGRDRNGETLQQMTREAGVHAVFQYTDSMPTGTCVTICTGSNRSMISQQAAANCFTEEHLNVSENWTLVEKAQFFYTVSFSLATSPSVMLRLARHAAETKKTFCLNLSAPFLCGKFKDAMSELLPYVDYLFSNDAEADEFARVHNLNTTDRKSVAAKMAAWEKIRAERDRVVVITQGSDPVIVAKGRNVIEFPVAPVPSEEIADTSGAGDAFVGGFLAQLVCHRPIDECVRCGIHAGSMVLRCAGCTIPHTTDLGWT